MMFLEDCSYMVRMFFTNMLDSKVVNYETELYGLTHVFPEARGGNRFGVAGLVEEFAY